MISIRDARLEDCDDIGLITVSASFSAFVGVIPERLLDFSWPPEQSAANWRKGFEENTGGGQRLMVAEQDEQVVGFVWSQPFADTTGFDACIRGLYVLPTFQGQGIGRQLIAYAVDELATAGKRSLEIGCVKENPSCDFYRHLGGKEIGRRAAKVDLYETDEILFGWRDIATLRPTR